MSSGLSSSSGGGMGSTAGQVNVLETVAANDDAMDVEGAARSDAEKASKEAADKAEEDEKIKRLREWRSKAARRVYCSLKLIPIETHVKVGGKVIHLKTIGARAFLHNKIDELTTTIKSTFGNRAENLFCKLYDGEKELNGRQSLLFNAIMRGFAGVSKDDKALANGEEINLELHYLLQ